MKDVINMADSENLSFHSPRDTLNNHTYQHQLSRSPKKQKPTIKQRCSQQIVHFKMVGRFCCIFRHLSPTPSLAWRQFCFWSPALSQADFDPEGGMLTLLTHDFVKLTLPGWCQLGCLKSAVAGIGEFRNRPIRAAQENARESLEKTLSFHLRLVPRLSGGLAKC